ncbi:MAG: Lrp/AsnC ligand binding domain-containing protein [Candidatus Parvarchaeota archaeon]|nr:Lrp/AsnC ligand binding domain-containing protein [Candidatus Parvarchaeota archaeon]MCL5101094.1 Lrp/AsnC ligand binding domain-containing protein [Candidatus Parvarchaeota archaeon]
MTAMGALIFVSVIEGTSPVTVARTLVDKEGVEEVMLISGEWDLVVRFAYDRMDELSDFVVSQLRKINGVGKTDTTIILDKLK